MLGDVIWTTGKFLNDNADAIQSIAAVVGGGAAGYWGWVTHRGRREHVPHLNVEHRTSHHQAGAGHVLVRVTLQIENVGAAMAVIRTGKTWLQQMLPVPDNVLSTVRDGRDPVGEGGCEVDWPLATAVVRKFDWSADPCHIEPGETEDLHFDFIIPAHVRVVQVYSFLRNDLKAGESGWRKTSIYTLTGGADGQNATGHGTTHERPGTG
jgi:hypothetical protein